MLKKEQTLACMLMGGKIPRKIKEQVIRDWIQGLRRDRLAKKNRIGYGTVTKIINEAREEKEYYDIELFRHLASVLNENGLEAAHVALALRLKKIMEENDMNLDQFDDIISDLATYSFRHDLTIDTLIKSGHESITLQELFGLPAEKIVEHLDQLKRNLDNLVEETQRQLVNKREAQEEAENIKSESEEIKKQNPMIEKNLENRRELEEEISEKYINEINESKRFVGIAGQKYMRVEGENVWLKSELHTCKHKLASCQRIALKLLKKQEVVKNNENGGSKPINQ